MFDHDTRERWSTRAERERAADGMQIEIRRLIDALRPVLAMADKVTDLEPIQPAGAPSVAGCAQLLSMALAEAEGALRDAVDASGMEVHERPVRAAEAAE